MENRSLLSNEVCSADGKVTAGWSWGMRDRLQFNTVCSYRLFIVFTACSGATQRKQPGCDVNVTDVNDDHDIGNIDTLSDKPHSWRCSLSDSCCRSQPRPISDVCSREVTETRSGWQVSSQTPRTAVGASNCGPPFLTSVSLTPAKMWFPNNCHHVSCQFSQVVQVTK